MRIITLACGLETRVSDIDYAELSVLRWYNSPGDSGEPYVRNTKPPYDYMHRRITMAPRTLKVDHWDRDGLNNERPNLRLCSFNENNANREGYGISGFKGVYLDGGSWRVRMKIDGEQFEIGRFTDKVIAAKAYDAEQWKRFGEFAYLNFPDDYPTPRHDIPEAPTLPF